jgi:hypothetical protein
VDELEFPHEDALSAIVGRYARVLADFGSELGQRALVLPNAKSFPDAFTADSDGAAVLVARMLGHAGLGDVPVTPRVVDEHGQEASAHGCSSGCQVPLEADGSMPRLVDDGDGWLLNVPAYELSHPVVLTTTIARALGHVFLAECLPEGTVVEAPADLTADYASVALGFGPLLLEGAYVYSKGCGGPRVAQVTRAGLPELSVLTALFMCTGGHSLRGALKELGATQSSALRQAHEWAQSNDSLVTRLRKDPERVAAGDFTLSESKPWLVRLFQRSDRDDEALPVVSSSRARASTAS